MRNIFLVPLANWCMDKGVNSLKEVDPGTWTVMMKV